MHRYVPVCGMLGTTLLCSHEEEMTMKTPIPPLPLPTQPNMNRKWIRSMRQGWRLVCRLGVAFWELRPWHVAMTGHKHQTFFLSTHTGQTAREMCSVSAGQVGNLFVTYILQWSWELSAVQPGKKHSSYSIYCYYTLTLCQCSHMLITLCPVE